MGRNTSLCRNSAIEVLIAGAKRVVAGIEQTLSHALALDFQWPSPRATSKEIAGLDCSMITLVVTIDLAKSFELVKACEGVH